MATVTSLYICISYIYTYFYNFNSLSPFIPIACQSFSVHILCLWHILYLYFFCIPISILYIFLYLSCVHLFPGCHMSFFQCSYSFSGYISCPVTYIISYPIPISCLLSCCGYTPLLYFSFTFLFSLLSLLYLFISFLCTILCTFYILYSYIYIHVLFISYTVFLLYFSYCFLFYVLAYVVIYFYMIFIYYAFHMLFVYYAFHILYFSYGFPFFTFILVLSYTFLLYAFILYFSYPVILYYSYTSYTFVRSYSIYHILCAFVYFLYFSCAFVYFLCFGGTRRYYRTNTEVHSDLYFYSLFRVLSNICLTT